MLQPPRTSSTIEFVSQSEKLRDLPAVHEVLDELEPLLASFPRALVVGEVRRALDAARAAIVAGSDGELNIAARVRQALGELEKPSQQPVINATGVVLHTNLGRAPLGAMSVPLGYTNLEYDLETGRRGKRDTHTAALLERLTGAPGIVVNNNAAAVFLALHELAAGGEAIVSRGELIEIGDGFRIPDIMARSGAVLREVGTTNRTPHRGLPRRHHRTHAPAAARPPQQFQALRLHRAARTARTRGPGRERGIPVYEDLGSGCVVDLRDAGIARTAGLRQPCRRRGPGVLQRRQTARRPAGRHPGRAAPIWWRACGAIRCSARCALDKVICQVCSRDAARPGAANAGTTCPRWP